MKSFCSRGAVQRPSPFLNRPLPGRERVLRTGGKNTSENRRRFWILDSWAFFFSENGSTRGVLIDDIAAAIYSSNKYWYLRDNMSCARAIDDTAVNNP